MGTCKWHATCKCLGTCKCCGKDSQDGFFQCCTCYVREHDEQREKHNCDMRDIEFQLREARAEIASLLRIIQKIQVVSREVLIRETPPDTGDVI